jgi:hypothetical protein
MSSKDSKFSETQAEDVINSYFSKTKAWRPITPKLGAFEIIFREQVNYKMLVWLQVNFLQAQDFSMACQWQDHRQDIRNTRRKRDIW